MAQNEMSSSAGNTSAAGTVPGGIVGGRVLTSTALIGAGIMIEPELLGGALLGAGIMYGLPVLGQILRPIATTVVQIGYSAVAGVGQLRAGAREQVGSIVSAARSEYERSRAGAIPSAE